MPPNLTAFILAGLLATTALPAQAQQNDPDLPDIAPREVEIRGESTVALPALERQPIRALAPPPALLNRPGPLSRVVPDTLAPLRLPRQTGALDLGQAGSVSAPALTPHGAFEASGGRYWSRLLAGRVDWPFSTQTHLDAAFSYDGTEGHHPFENTPTDPQSSSDALKGHLALETGSPAWTVTTEAGGTLTDYALYGVAAPGTAGSLGPVPERQDRGGYAAIKVAGFRTRRASLTAGVEINGANYETNDSELKIDEQRLSGQLSTEVPFSSLAGYADVEGAIAGLNQHSFTASDRAFARGEAGLRFSLGSQADARLGVSAMTHHEEVVSGAPTGGWLAYVAPAARLEVRPAASLKIYARNAPDLEPNRPATLFRTNPYLVNQPALRPTVRTVDAEGGLRWSGSVTQLTIFGGYVHAPTRRYFHRAAGQEALSAVGYGAANIVKGGARLDLMAPGRFQIALSGTVRQGQLTEPDEPIPYFASLTGEASVLYFFKRGELEAGGTFLGPRASTLGGENDVDAYLGLDLSARYQIAPPFGIVLRLQNALPGASERWRFYPEPPLTFSAGLSAAW